MAVRRLTLWFGFSLFPRRSQFRQNCASSFSHYGLTGSVATIVDLLFPYCATFGKKCCEYIPDSKVHVANMGTNWVLSAPDGPHVGPMNLAIRVTYVEKFKAGMEYFMSWASQDSDRGGWELTDWTTPCLTLEDKQLTARQWESDHNMQWI